MLWTPEVANLHGAPLPKHLEARDRGKFVRARDAVNQLHKSLFPED